MGNAAFFGFGVTGSVTTNMSLHTPPHAGGSGNLLQYLQSGAGRGKSDSAAKKPGDPIGNKEIFNFLFPDGWQCTPTVTPTTADSDNEMLLDPEDHPIDRMKPFFVECDKCGKKTYANKKSEYTGVGVHAKSCHGAANLRAAIEQLREELQASLTEEETVKIQASAVLHFLICALSG